MIRTIIQIDEDKCDGCGLCVSACHEGALGLVDGKARLLRDDYCDGMGDCLPACPTGAITFIEREAAAYDEAAVAALVEARKAAASDLGSNADGTEPPASGAMACEGSCSVNLEQLMEKMSALLDGGSVADGAKPEPVPSAASASELVNWPVQIKLAPLSAPYFDSADLLIAADCTAFAYASFHTDFIAGRVTLVGCPKLDAVDYADKLAAIISGNNIRSLTVARMQVPCCGGIENAARRALAASGKDIPLEVATISTKGQLLGV